MRRWAEVPAVDSEAIARVDYDAATHSLFVQFTSGEWYAYLDVPSARYAGILASTSKGRFFQEMIRDRYDYVRLDVSPSP